MLQLFRNNQIYTLILVVIYFSVFYIGGDFLSFTQEQFGRYHQSAGSLLRGIYNMWDVSSPIYNLLAGVLILGQSLFINGLLNRYGISRHQSYIPSISFILLSFAIADTSQLSPAMVANVFLLAALWSLFQCYERKTSFGYIFNAGFWVGIAAMCYWAASVYMLAIGLGLLLLRSFRWREFVVLFAGFGSPVLWLFTYHLLENNAAAWWAADIANKYAVPSFQQVWNIFDVMSLIFLGGLAAVSLWNWSSLQYKTTIQEHRYISIIFFMLLTGGLTVFAQPIIFMEHFTLLALPLGILLGVQLLLIRRTVVAELIHLAIMLLCLAVQHQYWFV